MGALLWLKKLRHGRGFGIHSPYAYSMVQEVLRHRRGYAYYAYNAIAQYYAQATSKPRLSFRHALLAFRVMNRLKPGSVAIDAPPEEAKLLQMIAHLACPRASLSKGPDVEMLVAMAISGDFKQLPRFAIIFDAPESAATLPAQGHIYYNGHILIKAAQPWLPAQKFEVRF